MHKTCHKREHAEIGQKTRFSRSESVLKFV